MRRISVSILTVLIISSALALAGVCTFMLWRYQQHRTARLLHTALNSCRSIAYEADAIVRCWEYNKFIERRMHVFWRPPFNLRAESQLLIAKQVVDAQSGQLSKLTCAFSTTASWCGVEDCMMTVTPQVTAMRQVDQWRLLQRNYTIRNAHVTESDAVQGNLIWIALYPRHCERYTHIVGIDPATKLIVAHDVRELDGRVISRIRLTNIKLTPTAKPHPIMPTASDAHPPKRAPSESGLQPLKPPELPKLRYIPAGFEWYARYLTHLPCQQHDYTITMITFTDGLVSFTVFAARRGDGGCPEQCLPPWASDRQRLLAFRTGATGMVVHYGKVIYTAVGVLPLNELARVVESLLTR
ncbi:MAG TPA: hypothetical protein EYP10_02035 [Armatimonadetes bacterium]|nr:hypothetical protein [Armatimonadota bacterium]